MGLCYPVMACCVKWLSLHVMPKPQCEGLKYTIKSIRLKTTRFGVVLCASRDEHEVTFHTDSVTEIIANLWDQNSRTKPLKRDCCKLPFTIDANVSLGLIATTIKTTEWISFIPRWNCKSSPTASALVCLIFIEGGPADMKWFSFILNIPLFKQSRANANVCESLTSEGDAGEGKVFN